MPRALDPVQAERASRVGIAWVPLVKLITYTDRTAETIDQIFYLSTIPVRYDYGASGTVRDFLPVIVGGAELFSGMIHASQPTDLTAFGKTFNIQCSNEEINGERFATLLQGHNLEGARIEISQFLVDSIDVLPVDLSGETGLTHTVLTGGRVNAVQPITNTHLTIECGEDLPSMAGSWIYASDASKTDPRDLGKRLPRVYGRAKRIPLINYNVGWVSTLIEDLTAGATGVKKITDGSGLPFGSFSIRIDAEEIACSGRTDTTITISTRGSGGTSAAAHAAGALFSEVISTATYVGSDRESAALPELYVENPLNGTLLRLDSGATPWTTDLADTTTVPGQTITSIQFSAAQLATLQDHFSTQASGGTPVAVDNQPVFSNPALEVVRIPLSSLGANATALEPSSVSGPGGSDVVVQSVWPRVQIFIRGDGGIVQGFSLWIPPGGAQNGARTVSRFRVLVTNDYLAHDSQTTYLRASFDFFGTNGAVSRTLSGGSANVYGDVLASSWYDPAGSPTVSSAERSSAPTSGSDPNFLSLFLDAAAAPDDYGGIVLNPDAIFLEVELNPVALSRDTDVAVSGGGGGAAVGFGLRFFADIDGVETPAAIPSYETAEDFESGSWAATNGAVAVSSDEANTGTNALKVTWDADGEAAAWMPSDALEGWEVSDCAVSLQGGEGHREGSYALEAAASGAVANAIVGFDPEVFALAYDFEATGWNASGCTAARSATEANTGTYSLKIVRDIDAGSTAFIQTEATTNWGTFGNTSVAIDSGEGHREGSYAISGTAVDDGGNCSLKYFNAVLGGDLTGWPLLEFDFKIKKDGSSGDLIFKFGTTESDYRKHTYDVDQFDEDTWVTFVISASAGTNFGSPDFSDVNFMSVEFNQETRGSNAAVFFDNIRKTTDRRMYAQHNAIGGVDFTSDSDRYKTSFFVEDGWYIPGVTAGAVMEQWTYISDDTWTGTTMDTNSVRSIRSFIEGDNPPAWVERDETSVLDAFSPDITNVNSMHIVVTLPNGPLVRDPQLTFYIDSIKTNAPVTFTPGDTDLDLYESNRNLVMFDFKIKKASTTGNIRFRYGDGYAAAYWFDYDIGLFQENTWYTIILDPDEATGGFVTNPDLIDYVGVEFNQANRSASCKVYLDNIKLVPQDVIIQNIAAGGVDLSSVSDLYRIASYADADKTSAAHLWVWLSDETWSGTDLGAVFRRLEFEPANTKDAWLTTPQTGAASDTGGPTLTAIDSIRMAVRNSGGIYARDPINIHYIDTLEINNPEVTYHADFGAVMLHPADIITQWIQEEAGEVVFGGDLTALVTALGVSAEWGFDARALGFKWEEVLQRMAFEARANIVPVEGAAVAGHVPQRQWRILSADSGYGFGAPPAGAVISQTDRLTDKGRAIQDIASHYSFRYAFDASLPGGGSEESFKYALVAVPSGSNVPISAGNILLAAKRFGEIEAALIAFRCIQDDDTAKDTAGYIVQERMSNDRRVFELLEVAWFDALPYDVGDIVSIAAPWGAAVTCEITTMAKAFTENTWTIEAVQVLENGLHT